MAHDKLRVQLEERLDSLRARLSSIKQDGTQAHSSDSEEQAQERENEEVVDAIENESELSIRSIHAALGRIEAGTYGNCEACGESIGEARLSVLPEATRCVDCAS